MRVMCIVGEAVREHVTAPTNARITALDTRIKALEERPALAYGGTWSPGQQSNRGVFYTDRGSVWYCRESTRDRPGESANFVLAVKRGADGRDLR
jgi:hypothetical protein